MSLVNINYRKNDNTDLFKKIESKELLNCVNNQNYIPIYNNFFSLNEKNYNNINLNHKYSLIDIKEKISDNIYNCLIKSQLSEDNTEVREKKVFFKYSGILDPFKYLAGKYDSSLNVMNLPKLPKSNNFKIEDYNNSAYIDGFFSFLSSQLFNELNFVHGIDFYGAFLGYKNNLLIDIGDEIDSYCCNNYFYENINKNFKFLNKDHEEILNQDSRKNKKKLEIEEEFIELNDIENIDANNNLDSKNNFNNLNNSLVSNEISEVIENFNNVLNENNNSILHNSFSRNNTNSYSSNCSSRSSKTNNSNSSVTTNNSSSNNSSYNSNSSSDNSEIDNIFVSINKFPIEVISLECCENTLDYLLSEDLIKDEELSCIIMQILMILITYQKVFNFTHNDLHTNNIMYVNTEKVYLYYKINDRHYKIKTYGKIFKIIDFGRAIYEYKDVLIYSDSFHSDGDANTQYNCEPYYDNKKPIIKPNFSFDLCRLGCSIYDFIIEKYDSDVNIKNIKNPIHKILLNWCIDDQGKDILYKNNREERYPDFKLYKMIARKVHNHIPYQELQNKYFEKYIVPKKEIKKGSNIMNIDKFIC